MKQIDIKKPKYIIPILILPFILGIGWLVKDMINSAPAEETTLVETEELNLDIPDANLEKREIKSKFIFRVSAEDCKIYLKVLE